MPIALDSYVVISEVSQQVRLVIKVAYIYFRLLIDRHRIEGKLCWFMIWSETCVWCWPVSLRKNKKRGSRFRDRKARNRSNFCARKNWCFYVFLNWESFSFSTKHGKYGKRTNIFCLMVAVRVKIQYFSLRNLFNIAGEWPCRHKDWEVIVVEMDKVFFPLRFILLIYLARESKVFHFEVVKWFLHWTKIR